MFRTRATRRAFLTTGASLLATPALLKETGGSYFEIGRTQRLDKVFRQIEQELRSEYSLGYISDQVDAAPRYRKIRLTTRRDGLVVQARDGYFVSG